MIVTKLSPHSVQIEWRPPLDDGGDEIRGYAVEMTEGFGAWRKVGYASSIDTTFTIAGKTYCATRVIRFLTEVRNVRMLTFTVHLVTDTCTYMYMYVIYAQA